MFYAQDNESSELSLSGCEVSEGDLVALPWTANMWYRGRVMGVKDLTTLRVFYLDYGSVADVKRSSARLLASQFLYLPARHCLPSYHGCCLHLQGGVSGQVPALGDCLSSLI